MTRVGPVQFIAVGFPEDATYEGRILAQIEKIEVSGSLRVLDVLFVRKDPDTGELQTIDVQSDELQALAGTRRLGVSEREIEGLGDELAPGQAAGMMRVEHVWAREPAEAIESTGGDCSPRGSSGPTRSRRSSRSSPRRTEQHRGKVAGAQAAPPHSAQAVGALSSSP